MIASRPGDQRELGDYLSALRRRWLWVALPALAILGLAWFYSSSRPLVYEARARVLLDTTAAQDAVASRLNLNTDLAGRDLENEINLAKGDAMQALVRQRLGLAVGEELPEGDITADADSDVLEFSFRSTSAIRASLLTNTWATAYVDLKRTGAQDSIDVVIEEYAASLASLRAERAAVRVQLEALEDRLVTTTDPQEQEALRLRIDREASAISGDLTLIDAQIAANAESITQLRLSRELAGAVQLLEAASEPTSPINAPLARDVAIGLVVGLIVGGSLAIFVDGVDRRIRSVEDVERLGLVVLGAIPAAPRRVARQGLATIVQTRPSGLYADGFHKLRTAVQFVTRSRDLKTILITSPNEGDGKSTVAVNLALACASTETRVALIDVDFRSPSIHRFFSTPRSPGFSDALRDGFPLDRVAISLPNLAATLRVLPSGSRPDDPAAFITSSAVRSALVRVRGQTDLTLLDAPPALPVADALSAAPHVDGIVVVVSAGRTDEDELLATVEGLQRAGGEILGIVVNRLKRRVTSKYPDVGPQKRWPFEREGADRVLAPLHPAGPVPQEPTGAASAGVASAGNASAGAASTGAASAGAASAGEQVLRLEDADVVDTVAEEVHVVDTVVEEVHAEDHTDDGPAPPTHAANGAAAVTRDIVDLGDLLGGPSSASDGAGSSEEGAEDEPLAGERSAQEGKSSG